MENEYNLYYDDEFVGTYTTSELARYLNISTGSVTEYTRTKRKYKKHYEWHQLYQATKKPLDSKTKAVMEEWDRLTEPYRKKIVH